MNATSNITRPDLDAAPTGARLPLEEAWPAAVPRGLFVRELLLREMPYLVQDDFRGAALSAKLAELGEPVLVRTDAASEEVEAFMRLWGGELALVDANHGHLRIEVAGPTRGDVDAAAAALRRALAVETPNPTRVSVAFWMRGDRGGHVRHREIEAPCFDAIAANYPSAARLALARLVAARAPERGRLILWRGEPGTGKSHALRALARAWAPWCSAHFVMDPEELFGRGGAYMLDVLTWDGDQGEDRWRLVVLEDAGELIAADARAVAGQALSRLLNVTDGLLGQGTRTLVLITTNEPVKRLHPATRRAGRCLADVEFTAFPVAEANAWLAAHGHDRNVKKATPLAELYTQDHSGRAEPETQSPEFGFARVLGERAR